MTPHFLTRPEGRIAYDLAGSGPLVVCVPGMGELRSTYRHTVPALVAAGYRVATMDLRGHGDSDTTFTTYDDLAAAQDALALVDELGGPALLIGNSMGAGAVAWAAAERPDLVSGLVLSGPFVRNPPTSRAMLAMFRVLMSGPWAAKAWLSYLPTLSPGQRPADYVEHRAAIAASLRDRAHRRAFAATTRTTHEPVEQRLDEVRCPVLVVMGEQDPDFEDPAAEAQWVAERLHGELVMVPETGHYPHADRADVVNPALVRFASASMRA